MIVDGQMHGALTQGLGQALGECCVYDEAGQLVAGSTMDYPLLRARDLPPFELKRIQTPAPGNPLGIKGMGEAGTLPAPPALANALRDALSRFQCPMPDMPFTPYRVAIHERRKHRSSRKLVSAYEQIVTKSCDGPNRQHQPPITANQGYFVEKQHRG